MDKLSKREMALIIILVNLIGYYILFNVIGLSISNINKKKIEEYEELKAQQEILEIENLKNQTNVGSIEAINEKNIQMKNKIFSITNSENIHYFVSEIAKKSNVFLSSIDITDSIMEEIKQEEISEENINNSQENIAEDEYKIKLEIVGKYEDTVNFIKNIESYEKTIAITDFSTTLQGEEIISQIKMNIYTIEKEEMDKEFIVK